MITSVREQAGMHPGILLTVSLRLMSHLRHSNRLREVRELCHEVSEQAVITYGTDSPASAKIMKLCQVAQENEDDDNLLKVLDTTLS